MTNIFHDLPEKLDIEDVHLLVSGQDVRIERIVSQGHTSPKEGWYDQDEHEWVMVLQGSGTLLFDDGREITLVRGDHITIPAHSRHKVTWTDPDRITVWLAVFYKG